MAAPKRRYLKPSVFWSIRQDFPRRLELLLAIASLTIPLLVWTALSYSGIVQEPFLPTPAKAAIAGVKMFLATDLQDNLIVDVLVSFARVFAGFLLAALIGVPVGIAMGTFQSMDSLLGKFVRTARYAPIASFVPLVIFWTGIGEVSKIVVVCLGIVFYNATMVADAVKFVPDETLNVAYTLGATRRDVLFKVIFPATLPNIIDALRVNIAGAWNFLVIAELVAAQNGLGFTIARSQRSLRTDNSIACILIICAIGLLTDIAFRQTFRILTPWAESKVS